MLLCDELLCKLHKHKLSREFFVLKVCGGLIEQTALMRHGMVEDKKRHKQRLIDCCFNDGMDHELPRPVDCVKEKCKVKGHIDETMTEEQRMVLFRDERHDQAKDFAIDVVCKTCKIWLEIS